MSTGLLWKHLMRSPSSLITRTSLSSRGRWTVGRRGMTTTSAYEVRADFEERLEKLREDSLMGGGQKRLDGQVREVL